MSSKKWIYLVGLVISIAMVYAHVCSDVLPGGSQYGCPDPETVEYISHSSDGNRITIISDVTAKHVQWEGTGGCKCPDSSEDGCYDNDDFGGICNVGGCFVSGFTLQSFKKVVNEGDPSKLTLSSNPDTSHTLADSETETFDIYLDVADGTPSQPFEVDILMDGSLGDADRPIYTLSFDWEAEGCTSDDDCEDPTPYCDTQSETCVECLEAGHCDDDNECTTDSCSSGSCNNEDVADDTACTGGNCCGGNCDTSIGNSDYATDCRTGPSCVGESWEYVPINEGDLCGGFDCKQCASGFCNYLNDSRCGAEEICDDGTCAPDTTPDCTSDDDCEDPTPYCNISNGTCVECMETGHCDDDNECTTDSCNANLCNNDDVANETSCTDGTCCSGTCDTTTGNTDYATDCRSEPICVGNSWEYVAANETELCGGSECMQCESGVCDYLNDSRCSSGEICDDGTCVEEVLINCTSDDDCSGNTPYCDTSIGNCVECESASDCNDHNDCTEDLCLSGGCTNSDKEDGTTCSPCSTSECECSAAECIAKQEDQDEDSDDDPDEDQDSNSTTTSQNTTLSSASSETSNDSIDSNINKPEDEVKPKGIDIIDIILYSMLAIGLIGGGAYFAVTKLGKSNPNSSSNKVDEGILSYIEAMRQHGYSDVQITSGLIAKGIPIRQINELLKKGP